MTTQIEMIGYGKVVRDGRVVAIVNDKDEIITVLSDGLFYQGLRTIAAGGSSDLWNFSAGSWERVRFLWVEVTSGPVYVWAVVDKPTDEDNGDWTAAGTHETDDTGNKLSVDGWGQFTEAMEPALAALGGIGGITSGMLGQKAFGLPASIRPSLQKFAGLTPFSVARNQIGLGFTEIGEALDMRDRNIALEEAGLLQGAAPRSAALGRPQTRMRGQEGASTPESRARAREQFAQQAEEKPQTRPNGPALYSPVGNWKKMIGVY